VTVIELGALGEFIASFVVMLTLVYLAVQVRQNTAQQKREETVSIQRGQNQVVSQMRDPAMVRAYVRAADGEIPATVADLHPPCVATASRHSPASRISGVGCRRSATARTSSSLPRYSRITSDGCRMKSGRCRGSITATERRSSCEARSLV
jgi:hypothetical protein